MKILWLINPYRWLKNIDYKHDFQPNAQSVMYIYYDGSYVDLYDGIYDENDKENYDQNFCVNNGEQCYEKLL